MDPSNQAVHLPEHLPPDESYIERLFPKCAPKQARNQHGGEHQQQGQRRRQNRRQARSSINQLHSRREQEARYRQQDRRLTNQDHNRGAESSPSSDEQQRNGGRLFKRTNNASQNGSHLRRSGKYMASQSLLQQLQKSQSSYNNTSLDQPQHATKTNSSSEVSEEKPKVVSGYERGIIKSSSAYSSFSLPTSSSNNNNNNDEDILYSSQQPTTSHSISYKTKPDAEVDDEGIEENGESLASKRITPSNGTYHKLDNIRRSDLMLDNEFKTSNNNNNTNSVTGSAGLVKEGCNSKDGESCNDSLKGDHDKSSYGELISKLDKRNNRVKCNRGATVEPTDDKIDDIICGVNNNNDNDFNMTAENVATLEPTTLASATSVPTTSAASADSAITTNAFKRSFVIKTDINIAKEADLISIHEPDGNDGDDTCGVKVNFAKSLFKSEAIAQKDDDQYINLFVYDNSSTAPETTNSLIQPKHNQKSQTLPTSAYKPNTSNSQTKRQGTKNRQLAKGDRSQRRSKSIGGDGNAGCSTQRDTNATAAITTKVNVIDQNNCNAPLEASFASKLRRNLDTGTTTDKYHREHQSATILPIHHSQQLLTTSVNDDEDGDEIGIIRNDASTEELCSNDDQVEESRKGLLKKEDLSRPNPNVHHRIQSTLQTVDEKAEINIEEEEEEEEEEVEEEEQVDEDEEGVEEEEGDLTEEDTLTILGPKATKDSNNMPTNQQQPTNQKKKACVPPGYPKRIGYNPSNLPANNVPELSSTPSRDQLSPAAAAVTHPTSTSTNTSLAIGTTKPIKVVEPTNQRVKFDESNIVSLKYHNNVGQQDRGGGQISQTINNIEKAAQNGGVHGGRRGGEHHHQPHPAPQMPIISETNFESEDSGESPTLGLCNNQQQATTEPFVVGTERELSIGMNRISFSSSTTQSVYNQLENQSASTHTIPQPNTNSPTVASQLESFHQPNAKIDLQLASSSPHQTEQPILRHHKLPNESSHFSTVRTSGLVVPNNSNFDLNPQIISHVQFNTLSDVDSGTDDPLVSSMQQSLYSKRLSSAAPGVAVGLKKSDLSTTTTTTATTTGNTSASNSSLLGSSSSSSRNCIDDDLAPAAKTALIFPRLDEGLSSEAESYQDDGEDDEEKAMDGDVDADDDDDDEDEEDDGDNDRGSIVGTSVDLFMRQQQQQQQQQQNQIGRQQNRIVGNLQQQVSGDSLDLHQISKPQQGGSNFQSHSVYTNHDPLEHSDLSRAASGNNYSNQNGHQNYWLANQQQTSSSQQQQFMLRNNSSSSGIANKQAGSNSFDRDEVKATNRLSSDTDNETDRLLGTQRNDQLKQMTNNDVGNNSTTSDLQNQSSKQQHHQQSANSKEVLIEGVLFNVKFLGTTESLCEGQTSKEERVKQAEMAVHEVRFLNGESQVAIEVQLFISTEKIMVLDDKHRKILMDHSLKTISYIADIGDFIVLIVKKKYNPTTRTNTSCHVFESSESHTITKSIDQAFQVAYADLLKAHGNLDGSNYLPKETDYQEVLNSQEMSTDELEMFARKENQREVIMPKEKGEILGLSIVESGWGSVLPTVVIASLKPEGPAYRCKKLSVGDQILSINGISLVGLPLADCQEILRKTKNQRVARFSVVPCPITVEVKIKRPDTKYQLGFSVQNGVICSLLRGGIAERGGVRVGHRIMSINGTTVVNVPHEKIVSLLASSVGEIKMKTCLTSLYRLILGEENPVHF